MPQQNKINILLAEDKEVFRQGLKYILTALPGCRIIAETIDGPSTVVRACSLHPNLILIREDLPLLDGIKTTQQIKKRMPDIGIIMLLTHAKDFFMAADSGADGYIMRDTPEHLLEAAIQTVTTGGAWIGPLVAEYLLHHEGLSMLLRTSAASTELSGFKNLTAREREVLRFVVKGLSNQKVAISLNLKVETVKVHMRNIFKKLEVEGRSELISKLLSAGRAI